MKLTKAKNKTFAPDSAYLSEKDHLKFTEELKKLEKLHGMTRSHVEDVPVPISHHPGCTGKRVYYFREGTGIKQRRDFADEIRKLWDRFKQDKKGIIGRFK